MIRLLCLLSLLLSFSSTLYSQDRVSPPNVLDDLIGDYPGQPSGYDLALSRKVKDCNVTFSYDHEENYGGTILLYYKVKVSYPGFSYDTNFLKPSDFEFLVSRDFLMRFYPNDFVVMAYSEHRHDYRALRLRFDENNQLKTVQTSYGFSGLPTSKPTWGWLSTFTCKL